MRDTRVAWTIDDLLAWAEATLGSTVTTEDRTWPHDSSLVLELVDANGDRWFLKHPRDPGRFEREVRAYETSLSTFGDRVAPLVGWSESYTCLLLGALPGQLAKTGELAMDPDVHRQAGGLLARLHRSDWPERSPEIGARLAKQRTHLLERGKVVLDPPDYRFVRRTTAAITKPKEPLTVPCHRDYHPRNWMVDSDGTMRLIDFGQAERDLAVRDFALLAQRDWVGRPDLREAFFDGYGRRLDPHEQAQLDGFVTLFALTKVVRAANRGNPPMLVRARQALDRLKSTITTQ